MVVPHPDDELSITAALEHLDDPVVLLLTNGEATRRCDDEAVCATRRLASFELLLDALPAPPTRRWYADLGDGAVTVDTATHAICTAIAALDSPLDAIVSASYHGGDGEISVNYRHRDHDATNQAVVAADCFEAPRIVRTPISDGVELERWVSAELHMHLLGPDGAAQRAYDWLAFSFAEGGARPSWEMADTEDRSPFARQQGYRCYDPVGQHRGVRFCDAVFR